MAAAAESATDTRRTDWIAFGHYGRTHYRIWTQFDGRRWWQRHEWKLADGSIDMDDWIHGTTGHASGSSPVDAA